MSYDEKEDPFDLLDEEEVEDYNKKYRSEVERSGSGFKEAERDEIFEELQSRHNFRRSADGGEDARRNFLEASNVINQQEKHLDPHLKGLMQNIDKEKGQGSAKKMLKESYRSDNSYFDPSVNPNIRGLK